MSIEIIPICFGEDVRRDTDLASTILDRTTLEDGDVIVVSQKVVSKQEGRTVSLDTVIPSMLAEGIASSYGKDPRVVELILSESRRIVRMSDGTIIVETHQGFVCANAGIDESNVQVGHATLLPADADASARRIWDELSGRTGKRLAVIVSDTFGRPFRMGQTDCAIGVCGISPIRSYRGSVDSEGRLMRVSEIAIADEICAAAELVKGKSNRCPVSVVKNLDQSMLGDGSAASLLRPEGQDLFR